MLTLKDINITLGKSTKLERKILNNLNIQVQKGEFVVVIGNNGAGKSTMLDIISGSLRADSGSVLVNELDITCMPQTYKTQLVSKVVQDPRVGTIENMSIFENMALAFKRGQTRDIRPLFNQARQKFFKEKLSLLGMGLENRLDDLVGNLSGGQRQALSVIMAILTETKILLLDEITAALDPKISESIMQLTAKIIQAENHTCLMITHNMSHAIEYGSRLLLLKDGACHQEYTHFAKSKLTSSKLVALFEEMN